MVERIGYNPVLDQARTTFYAQLNAGASSKVLSGAFGEFQSATFKVSKRRRAYKDLTEVVEGVLTRLILRRYIDDASVAHFTALRSDYQEGKERLRKGRCRSHLNRIPHS